MRLVLLLLAAVLAGCSSSAPAPDQSDAPAPKLEVPKSVRAKAP